MCKKLIYLISFVLVLGLVLTRAVDAADPNLVGYWTFDEGTISGTVVADSSGNENHGTSVGGPTPVPGKVGTGALALGPGIWIAIDSVADDLAGADNITVNAWVRTASDASTGSNVYWFSAHTPDRSNIFMFGIIVSQGQANIYDGGIGGTELYSNDSVNDNQWHMLTYTKSGSVGTLYVDGVMQGTHTPKFPPFSSDNLWSIGQEWDAGGTSQFFHDDGKVDEVAIWRRALTTAEIVKIYNAGNGMPLLSRPVASDPNPADAFTDVPRDVVLSWNPGEFANTHDVYLGTSFGDVNDASRTNPLGVLESENQEPNSYNPAEVPQWGQTYYWRVDEVNAPPGLFIYTGEVWQFTTEPVGYPIAGENITATASSSATGQGPDNTVNGSGLIGDFHSTVLTDMWLSTGPQPTWIQYEFDRDYKLHQMWVWNHNSMLEPAFGLGINNATIEYSVDGANWTTLGTTHEFNQASGTPDYAANTTIDLSVVAKYVKLTANGNFSGVPQYGFGLSEVRFLYVPVLAREPDPASGSTDINVDAVLSWRAGREATSHDVYLSSDAQAVIDETISPVVSVPAGSSYASYNTEELDLGQTYYWKINEVNEAGIPTTSQGDVWNFNTQEYLVVDGFEDYNDWPPHEIYTTWQDGYEVPANGSQVGELNPPYAERRFVHSGDQSMALHYDNSTTAIYSEATANVADLAIGDDWTKHGIKTLSLWFRGDTNNSADSMYVKIDDTKVEYDGEADDITQTVWQPWNIELADHGVNLINVKQLIIGFERSGVVGGNGVVYFDDIRLYPYSRELLTPVEPNQSGLVGHWEFDEGSGTIAHDQSGQSNDGTFQGSPKWVPGKIDGALQFDGDDDQIQLESVFMTAGSSSNTVAVWVKIPLAGTASLAANERVGLVLGNYPDTPNCNWEVAGAGQTRLYWNGGQFNSYGTTDLRDDIWHHVAWVRDKAANACYTYINGRLEATHPDAGADITFVTTHCIGGDNRPDPPNFHGLMDDFQIYSRALSHVEIAWLAGRTKPFDKPF